ncbi:MAG: cell division protein FtsZ [Methanobrevibacter sp.]|nr:cell division protein FtsZ [Methanobrevibacter sp.]
MKFSDDVIKESDERMKIKKKENVDFWKKRIIVVGIGGAGNNTITRISEMEIDNIHTIATNTNAQDLYYCQADEKILLGEKTCGGMGSSGNLEIGMKSGEESESEIYEKLEGADLVFITCGLGGGAGTSFAPIISKIAKDGGACTIAIVTMPFSYEGFRRMANAKEGLDKLQDNADTVIVIPNDKLLEVAPNLTINDGFLLLDEISASVVKTTTELITKPSLVSVNFLDFTSIMQEAGMAAIGIGESNSRNRGSKSVHAAFKSPLLYFDVFNSNSAMINITGSSDLDLDECETIVQTVTDKLNPEAKIIWGAQIDDSLENTIKTTILFMVKNQIISRYIG